MEDSKWRNTNKKHVKKNKINSIESFTQKKPQILLPHPHKPPKSSAMLEANKIVFNLKKKPILQHEV